MIQHTNITQYIVVFRCCPKRWFDSLPSFTFANTSFEYFIYMATLFIMFMNHFFGSSHTLRMFSLKKSFLFFFFLFIRFVSFGDDDDLHKITTKCNFNELVANVNDCMIDYSEDRHVLLLAWFICNVLCRIYFFLFFFFFRKKNRLLTRIFFFFLEYNE